MRRKKKTERQKQVDKADALCRALVRGRGYCQAAGLDRIRCGGVLQWCHIVGRSNYRLRWERFNALCMCAGHHVYYTHHPLEWLEFVQAKFPVEWDKIAAIRQAGEFFDGDFERLIKELEDAG